jgi:hypothetical protein
MNTRLSRVAASFFQAGLSSRVLAFSLAAGEAPGRNQTPDLDSTLPRHKVSRDC